MEQHEKDLITSRTDYLRDQIKVLCAQAMRDNRDEPALVADIAAAHGLSNLGPFDDAGNVVTDEKVYLEALHMLSSIIDKEKGGGWIAHRATIYRVSRAGRSYRNTDSITVQMANYNYGDEGWAIDTMFARAREVAAALNGVAHVG